MGIKISEGSSPVWNKASTTKGSVSLCNLFRATCLHGKLLKLLQESRTAKFWLLQGLLHCNVSCDLFHNGIVRQVALKIAQCNNAVKKA